MKRITVAATFLLSFLLCRLHAQNSNFSVRHYTVSDGLPSGIVHDIAWDPNGFMWISTLKGIARFDGIWMRPFSRNDYEGAKGEYSSPLNADDTGRVIFCDGNALIYGFRDHKPVLLDSSFRVGVMGINRFGLSLPSRFWEPILTHYNPIFKSSNEPIVVDSNHFLITDGKKLLRYDRRSDAYATIKEFAGELKLFKMGGAVYLYEKGRSFYRMGFAGSETPMALENATPGFPMDDAQIYWRNGMTEAILVENRNAYLLHLQKDGFARELICDDLPNDIYIVNIKYDPRTHTTAVASDGDGIYIYKKKLLRTYVQQSSTILSKSYSFYTQVEMKPGELWLDQTMKLDIEKNKFDAATDHLDFTSAYRIKDSLVLFHCITFRTDYVVWSYSFRTKKMTRRFATNKTESGSFAMTENRLFFADDNGLVEMTGTRDSVLYPFNVQFRTTLNMARDMIEYKPGYLVFCGEMGVFGFDIHTKRLDSLIPGHGIDMFRHVTLYKGYLLLSEYSNGIWVFKNKKAKLLPLDKNQYLRSVSNIFIDSSKNAWIAANAGIFRINADSLIAQFNTDKTDSSYYLKCEYYGKDNGLNISELNGGRQGSMLQLDNGMLSYTGINGIVNADIAAVNMPAEIKISADGLTVNNKKIPDSLFHSGMKLRPHTENIKIDFNIPVWENPANIITEYRLSGHSDQWEEFNYTRQNYLELKNLPSGSYVLEIRASSSIDRSHPAGFSFSFEIATPWYQTTLFDMLAIALLLLGIWAIFKWRLYYLHQKNEVLTRQVAKQVEAINGQKMELEEQIEEMVAYQERLEKDYALKNRLISIIGHDIITPLRFMNRAGKVLLTKKDSIDQATFDETLKTILDTGTGLQDMAVNMLNWIKHHHETMQFMLSDFDVSEKIDEIIHNIRPMAEFKQLTISNKIPGGMIVRQYVDPFKTILLQLLTNSIKYSEKGAIVTEAAVDSGDILISVIDEGIGMAPGMITHLIDSDETGKFTNAHENSGHGFGFLIIKDMLDILKGQIKIESIPNQGTKVILWFPAGMPA